MTGPEVIPDDDTETEYTEPDEYPMPLDGDDDGGEDDAD